MTWDVQETCVILEQQLEGLTGYSRALQKAFSSIRCLNLQRIPRGVEHWR